MLSLSFTCFFFALFLTLSLVPIFSRMAVYIHAVDMPNSRKVHTRPIPRTGGMAMSLAMFITVLFWIPKGDFVKAFLAGCAVIVALGIADDILDLGYKAKFAGQILAASIIVFYGGVKINTLGSILPPDLCLTDWASCMLTILAVVGVTNAINLADGLDGLAAGISIIIFSSVAFLSYRAQMPVLTLLSVSMVGAGFGFLRFNTYPATIFMGDTGSQLLGFAGIVLAIKLTQEFLAYSPVLPLILFGFPILDTLTVMAQRISEGRPPFAPDKKHFHHRLIKIGLFHTEAVFSIYVIQSVLAITSLALSRSNDWVILVGYTFFSAIVIFAFYMADKYDYRLKRYDYIDRVFKGRLRYMKEHGILVIPSFMVLQWGVPLVLLVAVCIPRYIPFTVACVSIPILGFLLFTLCFRRKWLPLSVRLGIYFIIPYLLYLDMANPWDWMIPLLSYFHMAGFLLLAMAALFTLKFTRRKGGFKPGPMDFIVIFILLMACAMPGGDDALYHSGTLVSELVAIFFSCEVLIGEFRGELFRLGVATMIFLMAVTARAF